MKTFCASAPGKVLWLGGYSVLEKGNLSYVTAMDGRVFCLARPLAGKGIKLKSAQFGINLEGIVQGRAIKLKAASKQSRESGRFLIAAANNCLKYLSAKKIRNGGFALSVANDAAFDTPLRKTGLGSSAAATVAVVTAILGSAGVDVLGGRGRIAVHNLSQLSHSQAQGKVGSGFDVAAAVFGPIEYSRYSPEMVVRALAATGKKFAALMEGTWDYQIFPLGMPQMFVPLLAYTGTSASTSEFVVKISKFKEKKRKAYAGLLSEINESVKAACLALEELRALEAEIGREEFAVAARRGEGAFERFRHSMQDARLLTKKLGELAGAEIEGKAHTALIQESMQHGAYVCRLPGAGGGDSIAAICLAKYDAKKLADYWKGRGLRVLEADLDLEGARKEPPEAFLKFEREAFNKRKK